MRERAFAAWAFAALALGLGAAPAASQTIAPAPLTLASAVAIALDHNAAYRIAQTAVAAARASVRGASAEQRPTVSLADTYAYVTPVATLNTPFGALPFSSTKSTNVPLLTVAYQLFDGGRSAAHISRTAALLAGAEADARTARMTLVDATTKAYFDLVAAQQRVAVADRSIAVARAQVDDARHQLAAGQAPQADVLRAQTDMAGQRVRQIAAENAVSLAQTVLDSALGVPLGDLHVPTDPLDAGASDVSLNALLTAATTHRADIAAARVAVDAAKYAIDEARAERAPRIGIALSDGNVQPAVVPGYRNQLSLGLSAVWNLFDGGATASRIDAARAGLARARLTLEQLRSDAELQIRQAALNFSDAKARVEAAGAYVTLADENVRLARVRYRGGVGTVLEVQDAELRASAAREALIAAQVGVREGIVHVRFAAGLL